MYSTQNSEGYSGLKGVSVDIEGVINRELHGARTSCFRCKQKMYVDMYIINVVYGLCRLQTHALPQTSRKEKKNARVSKLLCTLNLVSASH